MNMINLTVGILFLIFILTNITANEAELDSTVDELCGTDVTNRINVTSRTSHSFEAIIIYNCSLLNQDPLYVFFNETAAVNCYTNSDYSKPREIIVTCYNIENHVGGDWMFSLIQQESMYNRTIRNETFTITLAPSSLYDFTWIDITVDADQTTASIFVYDCRKISQRKDLIFRCNEFDQSNNTLSDDCTYTCFNLEPGSIYNASLVRLPIQIADKTDTYSDNMFTGEIRGQVYKTNLEKAINLQFVEDSVNKKKARIYFTRPRGSYDQVSVTCSGHGGPCIHQSMSLTNTTGNCSDCNFITMFPILPGITFACEATTMKENFQIIISDRYEFMRDLEPIFYEGPTISNTTYLHMTVNPQSDFYSFNFICTVDNDKSYPCQPVDLTLSYCKTNFNFMGVLGCDYKCHFVTKKYNYIDAISPEYKFTFLPPKPSLFIYSIGSRWIDIAWPLTEITYIQSFILLVNQIRSINIDNSAFRYNLTGLSPNTLYELQIELNSDRPVLSNSISTKTSQEGRNSLLNIVASAFLLSIAAPPMPDYFEVQRKIIPIDDDFQSTTEQHVIEIDRSLFSDAYGNVTQYFIYVRQDQYNNEATLDFLGTYYEASQNYLIDYSAQIIDLLSSMKQLQRIDKTIRIVLGNEAWCSQNWLPSMPCNGKLKQNHIYKIIVGGCTSAGCTHVLSKSFRTKVDDSTKTSSKAWVAVFPVLAVLAVIIGLVVWKRKILKECCLEKQKKQDTDINPADPQSVIPKSPFYIHNFQEMKPKPLIQYFNLSDEKKKIIDKEFQELENLAPHCDRSQDTSLLDRYTDIPSRGPWNKTAVHLTGIHRQHDYINANEIRGVNSIKQYIACQSPLKTTCEDFWDMVIQYGITKIVMLNHFEQFNQQNDSAHAQCHRYVPMNQNGTLNFKRIEVQVKKIKYYLNNQLEVRLLLVKEANKHFHVHHFYFNNWPRFGTIDSQILIDLIETVNQYGELAINSSSPLLVHCSSGTGRTGTYIAVDIIIHLLDQSNEQLATMNLDVMGIVNQLKHDRVKLVQTKEQYLLIHICVEEYLKRKKQFEPIPTETNEYETIRDSLIGADQQGYMTLLDSKNSLQADLSSIIANIKNEEINEYESVDVPNDEKRVIQYGNSNITSFSRNSRSDEFASGETDTSMQYDTRTYPNIDESHMTTMNETDDMIPIASPILSTSFSTKIKDRSASTEITNYEATAKSESFTFTATGTYTTVPPDICYRTKSCDFTVDNRSSTMFAATVAFNCSTTDSFELFVFFDDFAVDNCIVTNDNSTSTNYTIVNVRCDNITNHAGRNWTFSLGEKNSPGQTIFNETFTITLKPLSLNTSAFINVETINNITAALISIPNCTNICDIEYLMIRCNSSNPSNERLAQNCTHTCYNIEPSSTYNISLVRLPIPKADKIDVGPDGSFPEEILDKEFATELDKVTGFNFKEDLHNKHKAFIDFTCPRGKFDQINLTCSAQDSICSKNITKVMSSVQNCANSSFFSISPITRGVSYKCQARTIRQYFNDANSDNFTFVTNLEPVDYDNNTLTNTTQFTFDVNQNSDFNQLESICETDQRQAPCIYLKTIYSKCATKLNISGIFGCNYVCYFVTTKVNYNNTNSKNYNLHILPPPPILSYTNITSKSISVKWDKITPIYMKSFEVFVNQSLNDTLNSTTYSYTNSYLLPNRQYKFRVKLVSNHEINSDPLILTTLEDAPGQPTEDEVAEKIVPIENDAESQRETYVVEIYEALFSPDNGVLRYYKIYVRQDQSNNASQPGPIGTYHEAFENAALDYLALNLSISSSNNSSLKSNNFLRLKIGNETCSTSDSAPSSTCNDKLKPGTNYKLIVSGCTRAGCTSVLSKAFRTRILQPKGSKTSPWWIAFPILAILLIVAFFVARARQQKKKKTPNNIPLIPVIKSMKPRQLIDCIRIRQEREHDIYREYERLAQVSPRLDQSDQDPDFEEYDRYKNIPARGAWESTAVRLTAEHRFHDYINANEIRSFDQKQLYIACQGPLPNTCADFWDMIIQYKARKIVMLTRTEEQGKCKCHLYFPKHDGEVFKFNATTVTLTYSEHHPHASLEIRYLTIRQFNMKHNVIHYYYTGWPDFRVVEAKKLIALIETVNRRSVSASHEPCKKTNNSLSIPIVVHCSAGVGRTGTYIAVDTIIRLLDISYDELQRLQLDVMGIVYHLRQQRVNMIQTQDQYLLLYHCIEEYLRKTRRLEAVLLMYNEYVNCPDGSTLPDPHDLDPASCSDVQASYPNVVPQPYHVPPERESYYPTRSNTIVSITSRQSNRSRISSRRSMPNPVKTGYHQNDHIVPPLPPGSSMKVQYSVNSLHGNT
ncbi:unnamed protein product [Rotaria socialis]